MTTEHFSGKSAAKPPSHFETVSPVLLCKKGDEEKWISIQELEKITGATFIPQLDFDHFSIVHTLAKRTQKFHKKGELTAEQLWFGCYYKKEIQSGFSPEVTLRWINDAISWGLFAARAFKKGEFIAEYAGKVRKKRRDDVKNAYCFEYVIAPHIPTRYTIDARDQGGLGRLINHSDKPNLRSALATVDSISHVILIVTEPIPKGAQLLYDYGADYWKHRSRKTSLEHSTK